MKMKKVFFLIRSIGIFMIIFLMNQTFVVEAESVQSVETGGSLSFYGTYESEIEPQPGPPNGSKPVVPNEVNKKPIQGKLPKMGELITQNWIWLIIVLLVIVLFERHRTYRKHLRVEMNH
ncbi:MULTISPECIES: hypothetical protein [Lactobacillales]|jgi:8-oxo-dGTP diphosphatase|uniref:hypothetical protein n=1 Tax=Lactobacillales TaxID=186826 RepID=UPI000E761B15|nr:hypothetical protein [Carnobacterium maltaromaticum]AOA02972.1 hypothetical protein BFC23_10870 [Carnobacterium maltaromaticum]MCI1818289.1 hypothetical protein [Carnobacterium maltaromaticum]CAD5901555.1 conserved exported hypothetical protein [Carnobacterium maltaromaticum]